MSERCPRSYCVQSNEISIDGVDLNLINRGKNYTLTLESDYLLNLIQKCMHGCDDYTLVLHSTKIFAKSSSDVCCCFFK